MKRTVHLHGFLGKKYGKKVEVFAETTQKVMLGLKHRFGYEFQRDVEAHNWKVISGSRKTGQQLTEKQVAKELQKNDLHLVPVVAGADATVRFIAGAALFAVGAMTGMPSVTMMGASLMMGSAVELMNKPPSKQPDNQQDKKTSYVYDGAVNVDTQGGAIPLAYGLIRVSSVRIGVDLSSDEVKE